MIGNIYDAISYVNNFNRNQLKNLEEQMEYFFGSAFSIADKRKRRSEIVMFIVMNWNEGVSKQSEIKMAIYNAE